MIRRSAGGLGIDPAEPKSGKIEFVHKDIDYANRIVLADPVFQAFRKQRALHPIHALNEASHPIPPQIARESYRENQIRRRVFTQPGSIATEMGSPLDVRFPPDSDHITDIAGGPFRAKPGHRVVGVTYSMTSSARARIIGGIVSPKILAVLRLMRRSNLVAYSTGSVPGSAP
jgi:hypothetical protein